VEDTGPEFLTVAEVAARLRLNQQTIRNMIDDGRLPAYHIGRRVRIGRADFETLIGGAPGAAVRACPSSTSHYRAEEFWSGTPHPH
jgi:excisionase family DNA binding protein